MYNWGTNVSIKFQCFHISRLFPWQYCLSWHAFCRWVYSQFLKFNYFTLAVHIFNRKKWFNKNNKWIRRKQIQWCSAKIWFCFLISETRYKGHNETESGLDIHLYRLNMVIYWSCKVLFYCFGLRNNTFQENIAIGVCQILEQLP